MLPLHLKVNKLTTSDFQTYIEHRQSLLGKQTSEPLKPQTINKELYAISGGLKKASRFYSELENWKRPPIPFLKEKNSSRELNFNQKKFDQLLATLRKKRTGRQTVLTEKHRNRLADELEFRLKTGLRRKEVTMLKFKQYIEDEGILKNVQRFKTGTVTKVFPLTRKAIELIEAKKAKAETSKFIFSVDGRPIESDYRTLKNVCGELGIPYGRFTDEGFVPHDLRHQAATEIVRVTDIETAREYLGHSNINQTNAYLHTTGERLMKARNKRDEIKAGLVEVEELLKKNYALIKQGLPTEEDFIENMKKFLRY